ncbi:MAG: NUDIX domain-containing protein [Myxococcaceae bacterium]|nr:NUDIX domain-containing protein [Myxococcaceae bacterium]MCI0670419.1 NUDIX domain-containing protein [Myxococcaceae bacterium]
MSDFCFCPRCGDSLHPRLVSGRTRQVCGREGCGFTHWDNPLPVVAAIVEHRGDVVLVRNKGWPETWFGLVSGFLERDETPEEGVLREVREELGLSGEVVGLVGSYAFPERNELIVAYHVRAEGELQVGEELAAIKRLPPEKLRAWPFGTGLAVADWLRTRAASR